MNYQKKPRSAMTELEVALDYLGIPAVPENLTEQQIIRQAKYYRLRKEIDTEITNRLERVARANEYGDINSNPPVAARIAILFYLNSSNQLFADQAAAFMSWKDAMWQAVLQYEQDVANNLVPEPETVNDIISILPPVPAILDK